MFLNCVQSCSASSTDANSSNFVWNVFSSFFMLSLSAFHYWNTFLSGVVTFIGRRLGSLKTVSLSDFPGMTSTFLMSDWLLVKKRSMVLDECSMTLVGYVTTWIRKGSLTRESNWFAAEPLEACWIYFHLPI